MAAPSNSGTRDIPLRLAKKLSEQASAAFSDGSLFQSITPITRELLTHWFFQPHTDNRSLNFHEGQRKAILNTVYAHEILKTDSVMDLYAAVGHGVSAEMEPSYLRKDKFSHPKYCHKLATGTGKTWVMHALLIWQYLNAKHAQENRDRFSRHFLLVAPGLIVYDRLLDAYLGKENEQGQREFEQSDYFKYADLFLPPAYREEMFGFLRGCVVRKEEIGRKATGDGLVAITNWHALQGDEDGGDEENLRPLEDASAVVNELFPVVPGTSQGHSLDALDREYLKGGELEFLAALPSLVVFNDEAHHIHENKKAGIVSEVEWQKSMNYLAEGKGSGFVQIDFSATPYDVSGSGQNRVKHFFPHVITDFNLRTAIHQGLVKTLVLDRRKEFAAEALKFTAERDGSGKIVNLSEGQRLMLRAGLTKLQLLEKQFLSLTADAKGRSGKRPKMLVVCEETAVSPFVVDFLRSEGLSEDDVLQVDSDRKGSIPIKDWQKLKQRLFNLDQYESPRAVVSVLMLREGFDVNNICVIVPLRSSESPILLEQIIGRGLRLMWREPEYADLKEENRERILKKKQAPENYLDILSIVEHPAYLQFYQGLDELEDLLGEDDELPTGPEGVLGDLIRVGLREGFKEFNLFWPEIVLEREETLRVMETAPEYMEPMVWYKLEQLKKLVPSEGEVFFSEEITVRTQFGDYRVSGERIKAGSYNELLGRLVQVACQQLIRATQRSTYFYPGLQINQDRLAAGLDIFIRTRLFQEDFDPLKEDNWKVLLLSQKGIVDHLLKELSRAIFKAQSEVDISEAEVVRHWFSEVEELKMRERFSLPVSRCIYERLPFPSHSGDLEKEFILACDQDTKVDAFLKINETYHDFAHINYLRTDGSLSRYFPDFMIKTGEYLFLVETKGQGHLDHLNVKQKECSALEWIDKVNALRASDRDNREWVYVLLGEKTFYAMHEKGASILELLLFSKLTRQEAEGKLV